LDETLDKSEKTDNKQHYSQTRYSTTSTQQESTQNSFAPMP
jgi:hypothetical protein